MTRITISTDNPNELRRIKRVVAEKCKVDRVKGPKMGENGRLNYYIFVTDNADKAQKQGNF